MTRAEIERLAASARKIGCTPRELLVAAAASVDAQATDARSLLARLRAGDRELAARVEACANLLLVPIGSYSRDEVVNILADLWPPRAARP